MSLFGTSGIRGPVGGTVTAELALRVGRAVGRGVGPDATETDGNADDRRVVVGRDARDSGRALADALAAGIREVGTDVVDVGRAATPTVARAVGWADAIAGVAVTASHNPPADNGLKPWGPSGRAFDPAACARVEGALGSGAGLVGADGVGDRRRREEWATERHVDALVAAADVADPPRVAVDLGNGVGGVTVAALDRLGCRVETLNAQPDGTFPGRPSEPTADNCASLSALVANGDADLGLAHDGDADRLRAVAGDGTFLSGDATLAILAGAAAAAGDRVAVPVDTSLAVADYLAERGIDVTYTPVGDVHVAAACAEGAAFGGEPSGAWIHPGEALCPDGPLAAVRLVALAAERPLSDRLADVPSYPIRRDSLDAPRKAATMDRVRERVAAEHASGDVTTLDGVRVDAGDGWFLVRASGTEPVVRVTAEARDPGRADELLALARGYVEDARGDD
ncbi:MAG: phosphoglucosamine mutase [Haloarculaceae archaeon]